MAVLLRPSSLEMFQGATFEVTFFYREDDRVTPINLTGMQARMRIAPRFDSASLTFSLTSSPAAGLTITPLDGRIDARISALLTAPLNPNVELLYDLDIYDPLDTSDVTRLVSGGKIKVYPAVT